MVEPQAKFGDTRSEQTFESRLVSISQVRSFVRAFASQWPFPSARVSDIELAASELATNAIVHGCGETFQVLMQGSINGFVLRIVSSGAITLPQIRHPLPSERTGRGLLIVSQVVDNLSVVGDRIGVTMTCEFDTNRRGQDAYLMAVNATTAAEDGMTL